jgi:competence ComEA-like helix-hairpin-helix protein
MKNNQRSHLFGNPAKLALIWMFGLLAPFLATPTITEPRRELAWSAPSATVLPAQKFLIDITVSRPIDLVQLDGIGPVLAGRILRYRQEHGDFRRLEELRDIRGIGPKTVAKLSDNENFVVLPINSHHPVSSERGSPGR